MDRRRRLRWTDLFAALGILLLVAWTPAYLATEADERDLIGRERFILREPRIGDHLTQDLVVNWDGESRRAEAVVTLDVRAPYRGESPIPSAWVAVRSYHAMEVDLGRFVYEAHAFEERIHHDEDGRVVWWEYHDPVTGNTSAARPLVPYTILNELTGREITYGGHRAEGEVGRLIDLVQNRLALGAGQDIDPSEYTLEAQRYGDEIVFGLGHGRAVELVDRWGPGELYPDAWSEGLFSLPSSNLLDSISDPTSLWRWYAPDFPTAVGAHLVQEDMVLDILPAKIERGSGPPLPLASGPASSHFGSDDDGRQDPYAAPVPHPDLQRRPLEALGNDRTPLYRDVTLAWLQERLSDEAAPQAIRDAMRDGAQVVGFQAQIDPPVLVAVGDHVVVPASLAPQSREQQQWPSHWLLDLRVPSAAPLVAYVQVDAREGAEPLVGVYDACVQKEALPRSLDVECSVRRTPISMEETFPSLEWVLDQAREITPAFRYGTFPERFAYLPTVGLGTPEGEEATSPLMGPGHCTKQNAFLPEQGWTSREGKRSARGVACWDDTEDTHTRVTLSLHDGRPLGMFRFDEDAARSAPVPTAAVAGPAGLPLEVLLASPAIGGILLIIASLASRFGAWLKLGGHWPLTAALYAKIARSKVLDHERRAELVDLLRSEPGIGPKALAERLGHGWGATMHHLVTLERNGIIGSVQVGRNRGYFLDAEVPPAERKRLVVSRDPHMGPFLQAVESDPGIPFKTLVQRLELAPSKASRLGSRLEQAGLVEKVRRDAGLTYRAVTGPGSNMRD